MPWDQKGPAESSASSTTNKQIDARGFKMVSPTSVTTALIWTLKRKIRTGAIIFVLLVKVSEKLKVGKAGKRQMRSQTS